MRRPKPVSSAPSLRSETARLLGLVGAARLCRSSRPRVVHELLGPVDRADADQEQAQPRVRPRRGSSGAPTPTSHARRRETRSTRPGSRAWRGRTAPNMRDDLALGASSSPFESVTPRSWPGCPGRRSGPRSARRGAPVGLGALDVACAADLVCSDVPRGLVRATMPSLRSRPLRRSARRCRRSRPTGPR